MKTKHFRRFNILLISILSCYQLIQCTSKSSSSGPVDTVYVDQKIEGHVGTSVHELADSITDQDMTIPARYYPALGIKGNPVECYSLMGTANCLGDGNRLLVLQLPLGCTPINCQSQLKFYVLHDENLMAVGEGYVNFQTKPNYSFLHETFFLIEMELEKFQDNDSTETQYVVPGSKHTERQLLVAFIDRVSPVGSLSKLDLGFCRNLIFARYGYQFKSDSIRNEYSSYSWYHPSSTDVNNKLTATDKILLDMIKAEEAKK